MHADHHPGTLVTADAIIYRNFSTITVLLKAAYLLVNMTPYQKAFYLKQISSFRHRDCKLNLILTSFFSDVVTFVYIHSRFVFWGNEAFLENEIHKFPILVFFSTLGVGVVLTCSLFSTSGTVEKSLISSVTFVIALTVSPSIKVADQWQRAVALRLGSSYALTK
jgi:hypothetical protein